MARSSVRYSSSVKLSTAIFLCVCFAGFAAAQEKTSSDDFTHIQTIRLWSGHAPGAVGDTPEDIPTLTIFAPANPVAHHAAVIVAPGGAYKMLASIHEGREVADWFAARGFTAFLLKYRLGPRYLYPVPLEDAQRAVRLVRSRAQQFGVDPNRIGMIGFSAGGHLTATVGTFAEEGQANAEDPIDRASSRLNFMVLGYPWLNAMEPTQKGWISYCSVLEIPADKCKTFEQFSPRMHISAKTPPTFIFHTADDRTVPVSTSTEFFTALHRQGVAAELHIFAHGPHGVGFASDKPVLESWQSLLESWLRSQKLP
jgi:acetyl esterase/lipase